MLEAFRYVTTKETAEPHQRRPSCLDERGPARREMAGFVLCAPQPPDSRRGAALGQRPRETSLIQVTRHTTPTAFYGVRLIFVFIDPYQVLW